MTWSISRLRASLVAHDGSESGVLFVLVSLITLGFSSLVFFPPTATTMYCRDLSFNHSTSTFRAELLHEKCQQNGREK